jgi:predicted GNAT family N-acyltransferase
MLKVISFTTADKSLADIAFAIRQHVFVDEQNVSREEEYDQFEDASRHYLVYAGEKPVGTARWRRTDKGIKLERFAVLHDCRNTGAGTAVLNKVLEDVIPLNEPVYLNAQITAINFYLKAGFVKEGNEFMEANIRHYKMSLKK